MLEADDRLRGVLTGETLLRWVAAGGGDAHRQIDRDADVGSADRRRSRCVGGGRRPRDERERSRARSRSPPTARPTDGFRRSSRPAISTACSASSRRRSSATSGRPAACRSCATLNQRARALTLRVPDQCGRGGVAGATDAPGRRGDRQPDSRAGRRRPAAGCWCFCGSSGRGESLTRLAPHLVVIVGDEDSLAAALADRTERVLDGLRRVRLPAARAAVRDVLLRGACRRVEEALSRLDARSGHAADVSRADAVRPAAGAGGRSLWQRLSSRDHRRRGSRLPARAGQRLPGEPAAADVLPGRRRRQRRRARLDVPARAQRAAAARRRRPRLRHGGGATLGRSTLERFAAARTLLPEHERSSGRRPTRSASCCGSRGGSGSARARRAPSCRRRSSAGTIARC